MTVTYPAYRHETVAVRTISRVRTAESTAVVPDSYRAWPTL